MRIRRAGKAVRAAALTVTVLTTGLALIGAPTAPAQASGSAHGQPQVDINGGGGKAANGSDGIRIRLNSSGSDGAVPGSDQIFLANQPMYATVAPAPMLSVGGTLFGESGVAHLKRASSWSSVTVTDVTGSTSLMGGASVGDGSVHIRYVAKKNGREYVVKRNIVYTYPERSFFDGYDVSVPVGNTDHVVLYSGGDLAPGGDTNGRGVAFTTPHPVSIALNSAETFYVGLARLGGWPTPDGQVVDTVASVRDAIAAGANIGTAVNTAAHDLGLHQQWTIGSTPGEDTVWTQVSAGFGGVTLSLAAGGGSGYLRLVLTNVSASAASGLGFRYHFPAGVALTATPAVSDCGGTLQAAAGSATVSLTGGSVTADSVCSILISVASSSSRRFATPESSVTDVVGMSVALGTSTYPIPGPASPPEPPPDFTNLEYVSTPLVRAFDSRAVTTTTTGSVVARETEIEIPLDAVAYSRYTTAVLVNVTATGSESPGFVTLYACGTARPLASSLNLQPGSSVSNSALVRLPTVGARKICAYTTGTTHLVVDVTGVFLEVESLPFLSPGADIAAVPLEVWTYAPVTPQRVADTRTAAKPGTDSTTVVSLAGIAGVTAAARAVLVTVTSDDADGEGYVTAWPCDQARPTTSLVSLKPGTQRANLFIAQVTPAKELCLFASQATHLVVDVTGAFAVSGSAANLTLSKTHLRAYDSRHTAPATPAAPIEIPLSAYAPARVASVAVNVTATQSSGTGYVTLWSCGAPRPATSNFNLDPDADVAALAIVALDADARLCVYASAATHVIVDVQGWSFQVSVCQAPAAAGGTRVAAC